MCWHCDARIVVRVILAVRREVRVVVVVMLVVVRYKSCERAPIWLEWL